MVKSYYITEFGSIATINIESTVIVFCILTKFAREKYRPIVYVSLSFSHILVAIQQTPKSFAVTLVKYTVKSSSSTVYKVCDLVRIMLFAYFKGKSYVA